MLLRLLSTNSIKDKFNFELITHEHKGNAVWGNKQQSIQSVLQVIFLWVLCCIWWHGSLFHLKYYHPGLDRRPRIMLKLLTLCCFSWISSQPLLIPWTIFQTTSLDRRLHMVAGSASRKWPEGISNLWHGGSWFMGCLRIPSYPLCYVSLCEIARWCSRSLGSFSSDFRWADWRMARLKLNLDQRTRLMAGESSYLGVEWCPFVNRVP